MRLLCVGLNHVTAPLKLRELAAVAAEDLPSVLQGLHKRWGDAEFLLLSTCNRTELYALRPLHGHPREEELRDAFPSRQPHPPELHDALYAHAGIEAIRHLFSVTAGLDSLVPGESQIVSQVKQALSVARAAGAAGAGLTDLLAEALTAAKRVRRDTPIARGKFSVASVAHQAIREIFPSLTGRRVLMIGGGKMIELLLRLAAKENDAQYIVANRSFTRAEELAGAFAAEAIPFEDIESTLTQVDVVVTCTAASEPILTADAITRAQHARNGAPLLILDLAVPRDVDPRAGRIEGVRLVNIDDLSAVVDRTVARRREHLDAAADIVNEHVARYLQSADIRLVAPTIDALYRRIEQTLHEELAEASNKLSTHEDHQEDMEILRRTLHRALRRFCHPAVETLRAEAADGAGGAHVEAIRTLFRLDDEATEET
ncbi:MAG: glutamyl-tRNA reductase [Phycisphaerae bacterium]|nr:glutamyl-tRNA reductase [Phycisphaerae bacterium]